MRIASACVLLGHSHALRRPLGQSGVRGLRSSRAGGVALRSTRLFAAEGGGRGSAAVAQQQQKIDGGGEKSEPLELKPPRGTRDFYPEEMRLQRWLFGKWRKAAAAHAFSEYDSSVLENEALYVRKAGEEVTTQLFNFEDKGGRRVTLRPEMTPTLARMVLAKRKALTLPLKWYSIPQCWRYERMTRGRRREHYQWNMDIWGEKGSAAEIELLSAVAFFFREVGLTPEDVGIKINSRSCLNELLVQLDVAPELHARAAVLIDKLDKVPVDAIAEDLKEIGLEASSLDKLLATLEARTLDDLRAVLGEDSGAVRELEELFRRADAAGIGEWLVLDASVVRGLAYYTSTVFEAFDRSGELRAICGGGRYDALLEMFGAEPMPAVGFGFGDAVIVELLKDRNLLPEGLTNGIDAMVFAFDDDLQDAAAAVAARLRGVGANVDLKLEPLKMKKAFKDADRIGADNVVIIAPSEWEQGLVRVKDLATGEQEDLSLDDLAAKFSKDD